MKDNEVTKEYLKENFINIVDALRESGFDYNDIFHFVIVFLTLLKVENKKDFDYIMEVISDWRG